MQASLWVGLGGVLGALARYYLGLSLGSRWGAAFPWATLFINVTGCFLLGLLSVLGTERLAWLTPEARLMLTVGFCGAYTTFSTFGLETVTLLRTGNLLEAFGYVAASNLVGLLAVFLGEAAARVLA